MPSAPVRGPAVRELGLALPPARMPLWRAGRPLKRWSYLGVYTPKVMLCVGDARVGPLPRRWWAVAEPGGEFHGRGSTRTAGVRLERRRVSVQAPAVRIELELDEGEAVETATPVGDRGNYIWTSKSAGIAVRGVVAVPGRAHEIEGPQAFWDESAGYHARHTAWRWSAGLGRTDDGRRVGWNLVSGIHDGPQASERTLWLDGAPSELPPVVFAADLSRVTFPRGETLEFSAWVARQEQMNLLLVRSSYIQPFGTFSGDLPGGSRLAEGWGVMEAHDAWW